MDSKRGLHQEPQEKNQLSKIYRPDSGKINMFETPTLSQAAFMDTTVNLGDLHANTIKLLWLLGKIGIAKKLEEPIDEKSKVTVFDGLLSIYKKDSLSKEDIDEFTTLLSKIQFSNDNNTAIRLIGDVLADRGTNDYLTLILINHLKEANIPITFLAANHDQEFLRNFYEKTLIKPTVDLLEGQGRSLDNMGLMLKNHDPEWILLKNIYDIINDVYLPNFKLIDYSLSTDNKIINIYTHGVVGLETIKAIAEDMRIKYADSSALGLASVIEKINDEFSNHREQYIKKMDVPKTNYYHLIWNRAENYDINNLLIRPPALLNGDKINFCHGHDSKKCLDDANHIYNLDNKLGKYAGRSKQEPKKIIKKQLNFNNKKEVDTENQIHNNKGKLDILCEKGFKKLKLQENEFININENELNSINEAYESNLLEEHKKQIIQKLKPKKMQSRLTIKPPISPITPFKPFTSPSKFTAFPPPTSKKMAEKNASAKKTATKQASPKKILNPTVKKQPSETPPPRPPRKSVPFKKNK